MSEDIERYLGEYWDFEELHPDRLKELNVGRTIAEMALSVSFDSRRRCLFNSLECFLARFVYRPILERIDVKDFGIFFRVRPMGNFSPITVYFGRVDSGKEHLEGKHLSYYPMN